MLTETGTSRPDRLMVSIPLDGLGYGSETLRPGLIDGDDVDVER